MSDSVSGLHMRESGAEPYGVAASISSMEDVRAIERPIDEHSVCGETYGAAPRARVRMIVLGVTPNTRRIARAMWL